MERKKNPHAVALGRKGGRKGGPARAANMTPEQRSESARNAVTARWARAKNLPSRGNEKCYPWADKVAGAAETGESNG
jgi:hypothetical protein